MVLPSLDLLSQAASTCISRLNISLCASSVILSISSPTLSSTGPLGLERCGAWLPSDLYSQKEFRFLVEWAPFPELCASPLFPLFFLHTIGFMTVGNIKREPWARRYFTGSIGSSLHLVCLCALVGFMPSPTRFILHTPQTPIIVSFINLSLTILEHAFPRGPCISPNIMLMI
jgi:hypothetical protein